MKKFILGMLCAVFSTAALAADLPRKAPPLAAPAEYDWSGLWIGGHAGMTLGAFDPFRGTDLVPNFDDNSFVVGGNGRYLWSLGPLYFGPEVTASFNTSNKKFSMTVEDVSLLLEHKVDWYGTYGGVLGFAMLPRVFVYAQGGGAWAHVKNAGTITEGKTVVSSILNDTKSGWFAGFGADWAMLDRVALGVSWRHMDFGGVNFVSEVPGNGKLTIDEVVAALKIKLN